MSIVVAASIVVVVTIIAVVHIGYGQLQLNSSNTEGTPVQLSVCSSVTTCPFSESNPVLYTSQILTFDNSSFTNIVSLVVNPNELLPENSYRFRVSVVDDQGRTGFAEIDAYTESLPANGRLEVSPAVGIPLDTVFEARSLGWTDKVGDGPFFHRFGFRYICPNTDVRFVQYSKCVQWMTGLSLDNSLNFQLPIIPDSMEPEFLVQVVDRHGAFQEVARSFEGIIGGDNCTSCNITLENNSTRGLLTAAISASSWTESLAHLTSLLWSVQVDHETIICNQSQATSQIFNLSNVDIVNIKITILSHLTDSLYYSIPLTESYYHLILSLLNIVTKLGCNDLSQDQRTLNLNDIHRVLAVVEDIIDNSIRAGDYGILLRRGLAETNIALILSIYNNLIDLYPTPFRIEIIRKSLMRVLPKVGYGACNRQSILESPVFINRNGFLKFKSSLTNLPYDYTTNVCSDTSSCKDAPVTVNFDTHLLLRYLQWPCGATDSSRCTGVCLYTSQIEQDILWQGHAFSSLHKASLLHMSLLNPATGLSVDVQNSSQIKFTFPLTGPYSEPSNLECVVWEEASLSWVEHYCQTEVTVMSSIVTCRCLGLESSFFSVVERCRSGFYGERCNQSKLFNKAV